MRPALAGQPLNRPIPLYWQTHIATPDSRLALRDGDYKVVSTEDMTQAMLFNIELDPEEKNDLTKEKPAKFRELMQKLRSTHQGVMAELPPEWLTLNEAFDKGVRWGRKSTIYKEKKRLN